MIELKRNKMKENSFKEHFHMWVIGASFAVLQLYCVCSHLTAEFVHRVLSTIFWMWYGNKSGPLHVLNLFSDNRVLPSNASAIIRKFINLFLAIFIYICRQTICIHSENKMANFINWTTCYQLRIEWSRRVVTILNPVKFFFLTDRRYYKRIFDIDIIMRSELGCDWICECWTWTRPELAISRSDH